MSEFTEALVAHPEMSALEVARIHVNRHPEEQTRKALNVVLDLFEHRDAVTTVEAGLRLLDAAHEEALAEDAERSAEGEDASLEAHPLDVLAPPKKPKPARKAVSKPEAV